jgi:hypothetical protein
MRWRPGWIRVDSADTQERPSITATAARRTVTIVRNWPMAEARAASRGVRLQAVNLPAARRLRQSRFGAPWATARGWRRINHSPLNATASGAIKVPPPRRRAYRPDRQWSACIEPGERSTASRSMRRRAAPLHVPCRCAGTDAGGAIDREASRTRRTLRSYQPIWT